MLGACWLGFKCVYTCDTKGYKSCNTYVLLSRVHTHLLLLVILNNQNNLVLHTLIILYVMLEFTVLELRQSILVDRPEQLFSQLGCLDPNQVCHGRGLLLSLAR